MSQESTNNSTNDSIEDCLICLEPMTRRVLLPCGHSPTCLKCFITYNMCYGKRICPFCQREVDEDPIVTDSLTNSTYEDELKNVYQHNNQFHIYYKNQSVIDELQSYQQFKCIKCGETFKKLYFLTQHLKTHKMTTCKICHHSKRFLPSQTPQFTQNQIHKHLKQHPRCPVCPFTAFDQTQLSEHMRENHFRCEICADRGQILWFANIELLQVHLHEHHFACDDPECVQQGVIAFATQFELQMHQIQVHGLKIPLTIDFKQNEGDNDQIQQKNLREEHRKRITASKKKLGQSLWNILHNKRSVSSVFDLIQNLQSQKVSVNQFIVQLNKICKKSTDAVFCDVVAAIGNPRIRAAVIKERQGINQSGADSIISAKENYPSFRDDENQHKKCSCHSNSSNGNENVDDQDKEAAISNSITKQTPSNKAGGKKKQKKIVISSF